METIVNVIKEVRATSSTNEKQMVLRRNKDNKILKMILEHTYNPFKRYGVTEKVFENIPAATETTKFGEVMNTLVILADGNINDHLRDRARRTVANLENDELRDIAIGMMCKDLKLGIKSTIINKVWEGLIPVFDVQLATSIEKVKPESLEGEMMFVTEKFDGIRAVCIIKKNNEDIKFFSRNGKEILGLNDLKANIMRNIYAANDIILDGELLKVNTEGLNSGDLYRETVSIVNSKMEDKKNIEFHIFDSMSLVEFKKGKSNLSYQDRLDTRQASDTDLIKFAPIIYKGADLNKVLEIGQELIKQGKEGIMINLDKQYECKRVKHLLKVKGIAATDLEVLDVLEGTGRLKGKLGAVVCRYKDGQTVNVGSGFSDDERIRYWNESLIGKIIEVRYTEESKDKDGNYSLRFPRFVTERHDKNLADY